MTDHDDGRDERQSGRVQGLVERLGAFDPVVERELRERMRGRPGTTITIYLLIILLVAWMVHATSTVNAADPTSLGRPMFEWVLGAQLIAVLFMVPAALSGAIAGERERDTLVPLQVTCLRPWRIVFGKLVAGLIYLALLLIASLPIVTLAYLLGGVSFAQIALGTSAVAFVGTVLACLSVACSARARRTQTATVQAYLLVLLLLVGPTIGTLVWAIVNQDALNNGRSSGPPVVLVLAEPPLFVAAIVGGEQDLFSGQGGGGPFTGLAQGVDELMQPRDPRQDVMFEPVGPGGPIPQPAPLVDAPGRRQHPRRDFALMSGALLSALAVLALVAAVRWVRTPRSSER